MSGSVSISVAVVLETKFVAVQGRLQPRRGIDEKDGAVDPMVLTEFG